MRFNSLYEIPFIEMFSLALLPKELVQWRNKIDATIQRYIDTESKWKVNDLFP